MSEPTPSQRLLARLETWLSLNPDAIRPGLDETLQLADEAGGEAFPDLAAFAERLVDGYMASAWKRTEQLVLEEYFRCLESSARLLQASGEVPGDTPLVPPAGQPVALVPHYGANPLDWCRVLLGANLSRPLVLAVAAAKHRNELLTSVVEEMLALLHRVDDRRALAWDLACLEQRRGRLDPDLVRDFIRAWRRRPTVDAANLEWVLAWSADENLERQWPGVVREADLLLRQFALRRWDTRTTPRKGNLLHLKYLLRNGWTDEERLLRWLQQGVLAMGDSVRFFVSLSESLTGEQAGTQPSWEPAALMREICGIEALFAPVLILSDLILAVPDGAYQFALAFFGLAGEARTHWRRKLEEYSARVIRREFLDGLRAQAKPDVTIRKYCLGDRELYIRMLQYLDFTSHQFDSVAQREKVTQHLAIHYASFLEPSLLPEEVAVRYRGLMRVLHEDSLRRLLTPEQFREVQGMNVLRDVASLAGDVRRFLTRRRALETGLDRMVAAEMDFVRSVRQRRLYYLRKLLG